MERKEGRKEAQKFKGFIANKASTLKISFHFRSYYAPLRDEFFQGNKKFFELPAYIRDNGDNRNLLELCTE